MNGSGEGPAATVQATPAVAPSAPRNLAAEPGDAQVTLAWSAPRSDGWSAIQRYEYRIDGSGTWTDVGFVSTVVVGDQENGRTYALTSSISKAAKTTLGHDLDVVVPGGVLPGDRR